MRKKEELNRKAVAIEHAAELIPGMGTNPVEGNKAGNKGIDAGAGRSKAVTHRKIRNYLQSEEILIRLWMEERRKKQEE